MQAIKLELFVCKINISFFLTQLFLLFCSRVFFIIKYLYLTDLSCPWHSYQNVDSIILIIGSAFKITKNISRNKVTKFTSTKTFNIKYSYFSYLHSIVNYCKCVLFNKAVLLLTYIKCK